MNYETAIDSEPDTMHESEESHGRRNKRGWIILGVIAAVLVLGVLAYILSGGGKETAPAAGEEAAGGEQAPVVTVISPGTETVTRAINATGTLAARHEVPVGIVGEGGRVVRVYVNAGDWVKQGQTLASVDRSVQNQQVEGLRAQVSVAQSSLDLAVAQLGRAQQLVERGFISQADIDRLTAERDGAQARLRVARASVNEALARNSRLSVTAPTSGYILERSV